MSLWVIWKAKYNIQIKKYYFKLTVERSFCDHASYKRNEVDVDLLLTKHTTINMHHIQNKTSLFEYYIKQWEQAFSIHSLFVVAKQATKILTIGFFIITNLDLCIITSKYWVENQKIMQGLG